MSYGSNRSKDPKFTNLKLSGDGSLTHNLDTICIDESKSIVSMSKDKIQIDGKIEIINSNNLTIKDDYLISKKSISFESTTVMTSSSAMLIDFGLCNKVAVNMESNVVTCQLVPPPGSANLMLSLRQDGTGSRTISIWAGSDGTTLKWIDPGTKPTLTTTANKTDLIAFFYDASNKTFYGQASLNF